jgi:purine-binding chemotaxis protein CheW
MIRLSKTQRGNWDSMDIAKIRKKAREKEKHRKEAGKPAPPPEEAGGGKKAAEGQAPPDEAVSEPPLPGAEADEVAPDDTAAVPAPPLVVEARQEKPSTGVEGPSFVTEEGRGNVVELLTFGMAKEEFAFKVPDVEEIIRHQPITRVPTMPHYVLGITSLRGKIIPVIDLKTRIVFGGVRRGEGQSGPEKPAEKEKILILLGPKGPIGVTIDRLIGVVRLPWNEILEPPAHLMEEERKFVDGVVILDKRFVSIVRSEEALKIEVT